MLGAMSKWIYDGDATESLKFESALAELKQRIAAGEPVFQDMIKKYLLSNGHRCVIEMVPDVDLESQQQVEESERLAAIKASMTTEQINAVIDGTAALKAAQAAHESPEALASIPKLSISDLDKSGKEIVTELDNTAGVEVLTHPLQSNGVLYVDVGIDTSAVSLDDAPILSLFIAMLMEVGTSTMDQVA